MLLYKLCIHLSHTFLRPASDWITFWAISCLPTSCCLNPRATSRITGIGSWFKLANNSNFSEKFEAVPVNQWRDISQWLPLVVMMITEDKVSLSSSSLWILFWLKASGRSDSIINAIKIKWKRKVFFCTLDKTLGKVAQLEAGFTLRCVHCSGPDNVVAMVLIRPISHCFYSWQFGFAALEKIGTTKRSWLESSWNRF